MARSIDCSISLVRPRKEVRKASGFEMMDLHEIALGERHPNGTLCVGRKSRRPGEP